MKKLQNLKLYLKILISNLKIKNKVVSNKPKNFDYSKKNMMNWNKAFQNLNQKIKGSSRKNQIKKFLSNILECLEQIKFLKLTRWKMNT